MKRFQNKRLVMIGVCTEIPDILQILMWKMAEELEDADYLQVFELMGTQDDVLIVHSQEVPPYENILKVNCAVELGFRKKVYIIDDETHSTILLAEEY